MVTWNQFANKTFPPRPFANTLISSDPYDAFRKMDIYKPLTKKKEQNNLNWSCLGTNENLFCIYA